MGARASIVLFGASLAAASSIHAEPVALFSGKTATEAKQDIALPYPDFSRIDREAVARAARALGTRDEDTIVWFATSARAQRLDELPPDQRVVFNCVGPDIEAFERGAVLLSPAPRDIDPALWVHAAEHRVLWWPELPAVSACGAAVALLELTPTALSFGNVILGQQAELSAIAQNLGTVELTVGLAVANGSGYALAIDTCSGERLLPGQSCELGVRFSPTASGASNGNVALPNGGISPLVTLPLSGNGLTPALLQVQPSALDFGDVVVGESSQLSLTVSNEGEASLSLGNIMLSGTDFALGTDSCSQTTLTGGASCSVQASFAPSQSGARNGNVTVVRTDGDDASVALSGNGLAPAQLQVQPTTLAFGDVLLGASSPLSLSVSNEGEASLNLGDIGLSGADFSVSSDGCSQTTLAGGASCAVQVSFAPTQAGARGGSVTVVRNDGDDATVTLSGNGLAPAQLQVQPTTLAFGDVLLGESTSRTLTISNSGGASLNLGDVDLIGADFSVTSDDCSQMTLAGGASCAVQLSFAPTQAGARSGSVTVAHDAGDDATVTLSGNGVSADMPLLVLEPLQLAFGDVTLGDSSSLSLTVRNDGAASLSLGDIGLDGADFSLGSDTCSQAMLTAGASCIVQVNFAPSLAGARSGNVSVARTGGDDAIVALSGNGIDPTPGDARIFASGFEF